MGQLTIDKDTTVLFYLIVWLIFLLANQNCSSLLREKVIFKVTKNHILSVGKDLFKINKKDTGITFINTFLVSLLLTLRKYILFGIRLILLSFALNYFNPVLHFIKKPVI